MTEGTPDPAVRSPLVEDEWENRGLHRRVRALEERMELMDASGAATQAQVDADTAAIAKIGTDLSASVATIQTELDSLHTGNPGIDLSKLEAALAPLDAQAKAVATLAPQAPAPAPTPSPAPVPAQSATLYTFAGDPATVDLNVWPKASIETAEATPRPLFNYSGDTAPGRQNGANLDRGAWQVYTGATQPVPAGG